MTRRSARIGPVLLGLTLILALASTATAGDFQGQTDVGATFFSASPACPAKRIPTFESVVPIPSLFNPSLLDDAIFTCFINTTANGDGVKGVKGKFTSELIVRDNDTGDLESFPVGSGRFKTKNNGQDSFDFDIPSELFADGFESGDVSAWSYTRTDFTNKKAVDNTSVQCVKGASRSD